MNYKEIIWLASYPKSGNTWVRAFLDAYFMGGVDINALLSSITDDQAMVHQVGDGSDIMEMPAEIQMLTRNMALLRVVRRYADIEKPIPLFVKTHFANMFINGQELVPELFTKATIFIVRDPRDVLPSFSKHMGVDLDMGLTWMQEKYRMLNSKNASTVANFLSSWDRHTKSWLNTQSHNLLLVQYEDMKRDPVTVFGKILKHSGIEPDMDRVVAAVELVELDKLRAQEKEHGFGESSPHAKNEFFGKGQVGGWRDKLTQQQVYRIEKAFGSVMKRLGYIEKRRAA